MYSISLKEMKHRKVEGFKHTTEKKTLDCTALHVQYTLHLIQTFCSAACTFFENYMSDRVLFGDKKNSKWKSDIWKHLAIFCYGIHVTENSSCSNWLLRIAMQIFDWIPNRIIWR